VHLRHGFGNGFDAGQARCGAQGDFHDIDAACEQGVGKRYGVCHIVERDDGDDFGLEAGVLAVHGKQPFTD
jgi:hypothetical protein